MNSDELLISVRRFTGLSEMGDSGIRDEDPKRLNQVRVQTARWLRQRSINAAILLSAHITERGTSPSLTKTNAQIFPEKLTSTFISCQNKVLPSNQKGCRDKQSPNKNNSDNSNNDEDKEPAPTDIDSNNIPLSCTSLTNKVHNHNHNHNLIGNLDNSNNKKKNFSKSASLLLRPNMAMSKQQPALSRSFDSNLALRVSPTNLQQRKKSIYDLAMRSTIDDGVLSIDLEQRARQEAERAMKSKKIFTIIGPYPSLRSSLRRRGWVEKLPSMTPKSEGLETASDHLSDEKNPELITMMSQVVRNSMPSLVFSVKAVDVASHTTRTGQLVNHFAKSSNFTTKAGLCHNMKNVPWFMHCDPNTFYPRCYNLANDEEKEAFRDDFCLTSCCCMLKHYLAKQSKLEVVMGGACSGNKRSSRLSSAFSSSRGSRKESVELLVPMLRVVRSARRSPIKNETSSTVASSRDRPVKATTDDVEGSCNLGTDDKKDNDDGLERRSHDSIDQTHSSELDSKQDPVVSKDESLGSELPTPPLHDLIPVEALKFALEKCQEFIRFRENDDLDVLDLPSNPVEPRNGKLLGNSRLRNTAADVKDWSDANNGSGCSRISWNEFMEWSSAYVKGEKDMESCPSTGSDCRRVLMMMRKYCPQFEMEGSRNVWIIKPGAKSRGRGIQCSDKFNEIMAAAALSDGQFVVQKYIERPLLVYKTKFDVRQWFLVTDWNPLTVWFYLDCYLRFCSREFTLDDFHVSVHLSNNSVQKHFSPDPERSRNLPEDNMWTSDQFQEYLKRNGHGRVWTEYVVPEMKHAILCSLLCTQEHVECRKGSFELYGADFMITENLKPWLLEINSSPSMAKNTRATSVLVDGVMEDMLKVVLDRRTDKNCGTGRFELIYKQPTLPLLPNPNVSLSLHGRKIRKVTLKK